MMIIYKQDPHYHHGHSKFRNSNGRQMKERYYKTYLMVYIWHCAVEYMIQIIIKVYFKEINTRRNDIAGWSPSYGDWEGPRIITLKYLMLSSEGEALIPGAVKDGIRLCISAFWLNWCHLTQQLISTRT